MLMEFYLQTLILLLPPAHLAGKQEQNLGPVFVISPNVSKCLNTSCNDACAMTEKNVKY